MFRTVLSLSVALLLATPALALAGELPSGKSDAARGVVVLAGLDLSTSAGVAEARKRLTIMSERLCRKFRDERRIDDWDSYAGCFRSTLAGALDQIRIPISSVALRR